MLHASVALLSPIPFASRAVHDHREGGSGRALPTETKVESGMSQSKSGTSVNLSNSGFLTLFADSSFAGSCLLVGTGS